MRIQPHELPANTAPMIPSLRSHASSTIFLLFSLCTALLLFANCNSTPGSTSKEDPYHQGKEGVTLAFHASSPPQKVYEGDDFNAILLIQNKGAYSLSKKHDESGNIQSDDRGIITYTYDPFYLELSYVPRDQKYIYLEGKSMYAPKGDGIIQEYGFKAKPLLGQRESPTTTLIYTLCYPYQTALTQQVCIDKDYYNLDQRKKVCQVKDITFSKGQGAPIAITKIEPRVLKQEGDTLIEFVITIENAAGGNVITRDKTLDIEKQCVEAKPDRDEWNGVAIQAELLGTPLTCGAVKLRENKAEVRCKSGTINTNVYADTTANTGTAAPAAVSVGQARNFMTTLTVTLDYLYQASASRQVQIQR